MIVCLIGAYSDRSKRHSSHSHDVENSSSNCGSDYLGGTDCGGADVDAGGGCGGGF